jgi:hypothetical protein
MTTIGEKSEETEMATKAPEQQSQPRMDPLRHHKHYQNTEDGGSSYAGGSSFMERLAEAVAPGMGTVAFTRAVDSAQPCVLGRSVFHGRLGDHRPEGADESRQMC